MTRALGATLALVALGLGGGCSSDETYAYVAVTVTIDRDTIPPLILETVASCDFEARGVEMPELHELRCSEGGTPYDLGTFQWATAADTGILQFFVKVYDPNRKVLGLGVSEQLSLSPSAHLRTAVTVVGGTGM